jgi:toxoflavin synthase
MEDQYQTIGSKYSAVKLKPSVAYTEVAAVVKLLGDVKGKRVLDLACGTGFYTRLIRNKGAERVVGVDLSSTMIDVAKELEETSPQGIEYRVADVANMEPIGTFDIVTAIWLLHYARTREELRAMSYNISRNLTPSGQLIAIIPNPDFINAQDDTDLYEFHTHVLSVKDLVAHVRMDENFSIHYRQWPFEAYEEALSLAGFSSPEWHAVCVSPKGIEKMGLDYWEKFQNNPISLSLVASYQG